MTKKCRKCTAPLIVGENWYKCNARDGKRICNSCQSKIKKVYREANKEKVSAGMKAWREANPEKKKANNRSRMYVNGKYIPTSHPLYKAGCYKSFNDAAFTALQKDKRVKEGHVYAISNPAWSEWLKIGMAVDAEDRLKGYQTSSPMRDYELIHFVATQDKGRLERIAHKAAAKCGERQGEWFKITSEQAVVILDSIKEDVVDGQS